MRRLISIPTVRRFRSAEEGATAIEYALIACGVSIAILSSVNSLGSTISTLFYDKLLNLF